MFLYKNIKITILALLLLFSQPAFILAAVEDWQKGASISPRWNEDFSSDSFKQSVKNLQSTHANYVTLIIPYYQSSIHSSDVFRGGNTPTDQSLISAINYIHSLGMKVTLKIHVDSYGGEWRRYINPTDRDAWFRNYGNVLNYYADIAQKYKVEQYVLGTELYDTTSPNTNSTNTQNWRNLISQVRSRYSGLVTYSAQHSTPTEENEIEFWDNLDSIGLSAYFILDPNNPNPTVESLKESWKSWDDSIITPLSNRWQKPVLFSEVGYKSVYGSHTVPGLSTYWHSVDENEQARDYEALFSYWNDENNMTGVHWWEWSSDPNAGGHGNGDYTPQGKLAQNVMTSWFGEGASSGEIPESPNNNTNYTTTASGVGFVSVGSPIELNISVKPKEKVQDIIVDVEIYDSNYSKIFQRFFEHQTIEAEQTANYLINWSNNNLGKYTVKIGTFSSNWANNYHWNDNALAFEIKSQNNNSTPTPTTTPSPATTATPTPTLTTTPTPTTTTPTPTNTVVTPTPTQITPTPTPQTNSIPATSQLNIWWPVNGVTVSGNQPFKAMLTDTLPQNYQIFWQVDGGQLNFMPDNSTDYPHKEILVDVGGWNWRGSGPYRIDFIAKDIAGNTFKQNTIEINIHR